MFDLFTQSPAEPEFNGSDYEPLLDKLRLTGQLKDIYNLMKDGVWRTLQEIEFVTHYPQASISAQLRNLRKQRFGGYIVSKKRRGYHNNGLFEYRIEK